LRPGQHRVLQGHPWVFHGEFRDLPADLAPGEIVEVADARGRLVGSGYLNPESSILVRILTRGERHPDPEWATAKLHAAITRRRQEMPDVTDLRLVHAEADGLPGFVLERMGGYAIVSPDTLGAQEVLLPWLLDEIRALGPEGVVLRAVSPSRQHEGLGLELRMLAGDPPRGPVEVHEEGVTYLVDLLSGQKTGHYFDQRRNRSRVGALSSGRRVLDVFSYTGGFALHAARGGASSVTAIDSSSDAVTALRRNAERNGVVIEAREENAFDALRTLSQARERFDLVVLDPPPFARGRGHLPAALRAYKEINLRAMRLLPPGGILCTASCSHAVSQEDFLGAVRAAAGDAGFTGRILGSYGPDSDHPVRLEVPETDYLHCLLLVKE
jgi:23S rRNA (cytosine1962-C5)-methyltransferase